MSKLHVEVCKVLEVLKHPNADRLDVITIKGWNCIVGRDQYKVGDLVVYCPIDSIIPTNLIEKYKLEYLKKDGRVKTIKLRKVISQGLVLPVEHSWKEGQDVSKELGITKYEEPEAEYQINRPCSESIGKVYISYKEGKITLRRFMFKSLGILKDRFLIRTGIKRRSKVNLYFDKYTDIENIKNFPDIFEKNEKVMISEKIHGTNFRCGILPTNKKWFEFWRKDYEFCYGSHRVQIINDSQVWYETNVYAKMVKKYKLDKCLPKGYVFYGEIYGKKIQDLDYGLEDIDVRFFDIKDISTGKYLSFFEFRDMCMSYGLKTVGFKEINYTKKRIEFFTRVKSFITRKHIREGIVIKPLEERYHPTLGRVILKSINPEYLLRQNPSEHH